MFELYRKTTLGESLQESLDELLLSHRMSPELAAEVLNQFDQSLSTIMFKERKKVKGKVTFKGTCAHYRHVNDVWNIILKDATFKLSSTESVKTDRIVLFAMDAKATGSN